MFLRPKTLTCTSATRTRTACELPSKCISQASLDAGVNFIDTAPAYGIGFFERVMGEAIRGRRDKVILAKCGLFWHRAKRNFFVDQNARASTAFFGRSAYAIGVRQCTVLAE
jgi:aryl-alcohol dehydrogenase-like predicted oxidoreductase